MKIKNERAQNRIIFSKLLYSSLKDGTLMGTLRWERESGALVHWNLSGVLSHHRSRTI
jgi:hypothetical protein